MLTLLMPTLMFDSAFKMSTHAFLSNVEKIVLVAAGAYTITVLMQGITLFLALYPLGVTLPQVSQGYCIGLL